MSKHVREFYDKFSETQQKLAFNERHFLMLQKMIEIGFDNKNSLLELGCGIGVITKLLSTYFPKSSITSVDISPKSIDIARKNVPSKNVEFICHDITALDISPKKYDFVCLFDVLEHIPLERHTHLMEVIDLHLSENGVLILNIPNDKAIEHLAKNDPESLQVIDLPLKNEYLMKLFSEKFELISFELYDLFIKNESKFLVFKRDKPYIYRKNDLKITNIISKYRTKKIINKLNGNF